MELTTTEDVSDSLVREFESNLAVGCIYLHPLPPVVVPYGDGQLIVDNWKGVVAELLPARPSLFDLLLLS